RPIVDDRPPRRGNREAWAAPPPWLRGSGGGASPERPGSGSAGRPPGDDEGRTALGAAGLAAAGLGASEAAAAGGLSGSFADRLASERGAPFPVAGPGTTCAGRTGDPGMEPTDESPQRPAPSHAAVRSEDDGSRYLDHSDDEDDAEGPPPRHRRRERLEAGSDRIEAHRERDIGAPSWERPRRLEAYPTLRSRRLSGPLMSIALGLIALLLVAGGAFALSKIFGLGGAGAGASPTPSVAASVSPSGETFEPTLAPGPTPFLYTVEQGDTLTKIAKRFNISLADLIDANKTTHPNPNVLAVGDQLIIPVPTPSSLPGASPASS
ncbi:MAG TPA: LysM domain-containing protein, partial [Candidatus Binatus sp.]|nr:LysM domain-containing protein [Candidatus Binatus sp.]